MPWTPLQKRDQALQSRFSEMLLKLGKQDEADDFYNNNDLGQLDSDAFSARVEEIKQGQNSDHSPTITNKSDHEKTIDNDSSASNQIEEGDEYSSKSLRYLRSHADTPEARQRADLLYSQILLDLWRQYVMESGETYYPPLAEDLFEFYQFHQEQDAT